MPADPETVAAIISHLDTRLSQQDALRADEFRDVYKKIDDHAAKSELSIQRLELQVVKIDTTLHGHIKTTEDRFNGIGAAKKASDDRKDGWARAIAGSVLGGGTILAFIEWLRSGGKG